MSWRVCSMLKIRCITLRTLIHTNRYLTHETQHSQVIHLITSRLTINPSKQIPSSYLFSEFPPFLPRHSLRFLTPLAAAGTSSKMPWSWSKCPVSASTWEDASKWQSYQGHITSYTNIHVHVTLPETNIADIAPKNNGFQVRNLLFQGFVFRCYVRFREG